MDGDGLAQKALGHVKLASAAGLAVLGDAVLAAHGVPPVTAPAVAGAQAVVVTARAAFHHALEEVARVLELASGVTLDESLERLGAESDAAAGLFAALNSLLDHPGRERARLLGAILGETVNDEGVNEQDGLRVLLDLALSLQVGHLRVLQLVEDLRGAVPRGEAWVGTEQMNASLPGYQRVLGSLIAACVANGTLVERQGEGLAYGPSGMGEWAATELGVTIVGFLTRYAPTD